MSYHGQSGFKNSPNLHPSLPAKPNGPLPPAFKRGPPGDVNTSGAGFGYGSTSGGGGYSNTSGGGQASYGATAGPYRPQAVAPVTQGWQQQAYSPTVSAPPAPPTGYSAPTTSYANNYQQPYQPQQQYQQPQANYYSQPSYESYPTASAPQIQNPFPLPGLGANKANGNNSFDPEYEAQVAQWASAYAPKDESANTKGYGKKEQLGNANTMPLGVRGSATTQLSNQELSAAATTDSRAAAVVTGADGKQKTVVRSGGGKTWQDSSLLEWDPTHPRLFIGNLAGEVTDDSLFKAFSKYSSISKAHVVRDKRTTKSKGFGFVSFANSDDYFQAAKEMQGKYIGSHPVLIKRSTTEIKAVAPPAKGKKGKNNKHGGNDKKQSGDAGGVGTGAGIKKPKKQGGLRVLG